MKLDNFFKIIIEASQPRGDLFRAEALRAICRLGQERFETSPYTISGCESISLGTLVALMQNTTCLSLTEADVKSALSTIRMCVPFWKNTTVITQCISTGCPDVPAQCIHYGEIPAILYVFTDQNFFGDGPNNERVSYSFLLVFVARKNWVSFYTDSLNGPPFDDGIIRIAGVESRIKFKLFTRYVNTGIVYFVLAAGLIFLIMCLYLKSILITLATILSILFSVMFAYFLYFVIFQFPFFPFVNTLAILIVVAIGADDVFIFCDTWNQLKHTHPDESAESLMHKTMMHAGLSIFVTSFTTATAFAVNLVSNITAIRCFGAFASTCILCNFLLMVTWIPAAVVIIKTREYQNIVKPKCGQWIDKVSSYLQPVPDFIFHRALPFVVDKAYFILIPLFLLLGIGGVFITLVHPKLVIPTTAAFQLFTENHPFERFDSLVFNNEFRFTRILTQADSLMTFMWGVQPTDNGNHLDPFDNGHIILDPSFNLTSSWTWMRDFCIALKNSSLIFREDKAKQCLLEAFEKHIRSPCRLFRDRRCCRYYGVLPAGLFQKCFLSFIVESNYTFKDALGLPYFNSNNEVVAYRFSVHSSQKFSTSHAAAEKFYQNMSTFWDQQMATAPNEVKGGWFVSGFSLYDLQNALSTGTIKAIMLSLGSALVVMLFTSRNIFLTLFAIVTITLAIFSTVGSLVLLDWKLGILEAIVITASAGLPIDFAIHYAVAYRHAATPDRQSRVRHALVSVGSPVAMAAITTFVAGAAILPADLLAYQQLAVFLMLIMLNSWAFATLFFLPVCRLMGPHGDLGRIPSPIAYIKKLIPERIKT